MITKAQAEALDAVLRDPELLRRAKAAVQGGQAQVTKAKPGSMYDRLSKLSAGGVAQAGLTTKAARLPFHGQATYERLRAVSAGLANGTLRMKAATATSSYEQALLDEIAANNQVNASGEALNAAIDAAQTASMRRTQLKVQLLNSGQADVVNEVEDKHWEDLAHSQGDNVGAPPVGKQARAFGF